MGYVHNRPLGSVGPVLADVAGSNPASGTYRYYTLDHLGSTNGLYDGAKAKVSSLAYTPYGAAYSDVGPGPLPRYTGHLWEAVAGLHLAPYRAYAPTLARWLSRDPLGMVDGPNVYGYVMSNPVSGVDSLGLVDRRPPANGQVCNNSTTDIQVLYNGKYCKLGGGECTTNWNLSVDEDGLWGEWMDADGTGAVGNSTSHLWVEWAQAPAMRMAPQMASQQRLQVEDVRLAMIPLRTPTIFRNAVTAILAPRTRCRNLTIPILRGGEASSDRY